MILTLLPKNLAKAGFSFVAGKGDTECKDCRFFKTCVDNLKPGRIYTVTSVRNIEHPCKIHDSGVKIVEVKESQIEAAIPKKYAIEGAKINQGISFVTENGKVYVTKEGQKQRNQSNEFIQYEDWLEPILSKFEIKQRKTPDAKLDEKGNPIEIKEDSEAVKRLKATYEAKGITVGATA